MPGTKFICPSCGHMGNFRAQFTWSGTVDSEGRYETPTDKRIAHLTCLSCGYSDVKSAFLSVRFGVIEIEWEESHRYTAKLQVSVQEGQDLEEWLEEPTGAGMERWFNIVDSQLSDGQALVDDHLVAVDHRALTYCKWVSQPPTESKDD